MKKKVLSLVLAVLMVVTCFSTIITTQAAGTLTDVKVDGEEYLLATANEPLDLTTKTFTGKVDSQTVTLVPILITKVTYNGVELTGDSALNTTSITPENDKGVYLMDIMFSDGKTASVPMAVKAAEAEEYVLYEENFDGIEEGTIPEGWDTLDGANFTYSVKDGKLKLASNKEYAFARILAPEYVSVFSNPIISADLNFDSYITTTRWMSIMYRIQMNGSTPSEYYQLATRVLSKTAPGGGFEFAHNVGGQWANDETVKKPGLVDMDDRSVHNFKCELGDKYVYEYMDDQKITTGKMDPKYRGGRMGFSVDGAAMSVDNLKITLNTNVTIPPFDPVAAELATVYQPKTAISAAPVIGLDLKDENAVLDMDKTKTQATTFIYVNDNLQIVDSTYQNEIDKFGRTLDEVITNIYKKTIPVICVNTVEAATKAAKYIEDKNIIDCYIAATSNEALEAASKAPSGDGDTGTTRLIRNYANLDKEALTTDELFDMVKETNTNWSKTILLPQKLLTKENVAYLQKHLMFVWGMAEVADFESALKVIQTGANGIVSENYDIFIDALERFTGDTPILVRKPFIIGHRGAYHERQENSIEGTVLAYDKYGAEIVENDVYITKDNAIAVQHDAVVSHYWDISGTTIGANTNVENCTRAQLENLKSLKYPDTKFPFLEDYFKVLKERPDKILSIEMKTQKPEAVTLIKEMIEEYDVADQVFIITFYDSNLARLREEMPWISTGFLKYGYENATSKIQQIMQFTRKYNSTYNPTFRYSSMDVSKDVIDAGLLRSIYSSPWTFDKKNSAASTFDFYNSYANGMFGLTTNYPHWAADLITSVNENKAETITAEVSSDFQYEVTCETRNGEEVSVKTANALIVSQSEDGVAEINADGNLVGLKPGTAQVLFMPAMTKRIPINIGETKTEIRDIYRLLTDNIVTVEYQEFTDYVTEIEIANAPEKNQKINEELNLEGAKIKYTTALGVTDEINIESDMISGYDNTKEGKQTVTVTYEGKTCTFNVFVYDGLLLAVNGNDVVTDEFGNVTIEASNGDNEIDFEVINGATYELYSDIGAINMLTPKDGVYTVNTKGQTITRVYLVANYGEEYGYYIINLIKDYEEIDFPDEKLQDEDYYATPYIEFVKFLGIVTGKDDGYLYPEDNATRYEAIVMIMRYLGVDTSAFAGYENPFEDVPENYATNAVKAAVAMGITNGDGEGHFNGDSNITRVEFYAMFIRASQIVEEEYEQQENETAEEYKQRLSGEVDKIFTDNKEGLMPQEVWAYKTILTAYKTGLTTGIEEGVFGAEINIQRDSIMVIIARALGIEEILG